jgi:hypothetical protein
VIEGEKIGNYRRKSYKKKSKEPSKNDPKNIIIDELFYLKNIIEKNNKKIKYNNFKKMKIKV